MGGKREIGSKTSFWITTFLGPVIGLIAVALSKKREAKQIDYYAELLKFSALKDKGLISESDFNGEKQKLDYARNNIEELKPDNTGIYYYIIALLIVLTICAINLFAVYYLYNENEAKKKFSETKSASEQITTTNQPHSTNKQYEEISKSNMSEQADMSPLLQIRSSKLEALEYTSSGKYISTNSESKAVLFTFSFETLESPSLKKGAIRLYIRLIDPNHETVIGEDNQGGAFKLANSSETIKYTETLDFDSRLNNNKLESYGINPGNPYSFQFQKGRYKLEIYQYGGYFLSGAELELK